KKSKPKFTGNQIPVSEMWNIFRKVLDKLMELKRYEHLQNLLLASLSSTMFMKLPRYAKNLNKNKAWNLYSLIASCSPENRQNRFCMRLMLKNHNHLALGYINGHNAMMSGTYKHAL
ncbi:general transcription factor 3C polypeptide 3, partial [Caerostris darwini]